MDAACSRVRGEPSVAGGGLHDARRSVGFKPESIRAEISLPWTAIAIRSWRRRQAPPRRLHMRKRSTGTFVFVALASLGLAGIVGAATPSHCRKDCKQDIKNCLALVPKNKDCTGTKAEKKACRKNYATQRKTCRGLPKLCKQQNPNTSGVCLPSSTSTTTPTPTTSPFLNNTTTTTSTHAPT